GRVVDVGTEAELMARCPLFRDLLAVPDELHERATDGVGEADRGRLWPDPGSAGTVPEPRSAPRVDAAAPRGGGRMGAAGDLAPTPELLAAVEALPPATDVPRVAGEDPRAPDPGFRLARLLRPVRWALVVGIALVALDALASLAFPAVTRFAIDGGITAGAPDVLVTASLLGIGLVTARAGETLLYLLRVRSYAHLQRLGLDYFERELSGRIMTRMTTDVDALSTFLQTGLVQAVVSVLTIGGVAVALLVTDVELALV